ncbi:MAG: alanine racemase [Pseudomonadota bacterium]
MKLHSRRTFLKTSAVLAATSGWAADALASSLQQVGTQTDLSDHFRGWVEFSRAALQHNAAEIVRATGVPLCACVKHHGYGLGEGNVAGAIDSVSGVWGYMVARPDEAWRLVEAKVKKPVLLLGPADERTSINLARAGVVLGLSGKDDVATVAPIARALGRPVTAHLEVDTGIHRQGISYEQAVERGVALNKSGAVRFTGLSSYFASAPRDAPREPWPYELKQIDRFNAVAHGLDRARVAYGKRHMVTSITLFQYPQAIYEMTRCGALVYGGMHPDALAWGKNKDQLSLKQSYEVKARLAQITRIPAGDGVGYGQRFSTNKPVYVGLILLAGLDGYRPNLDDGVVLLNGTERRVIARTSQHSMILLGDEPHARVGDVVTVYGKDPRVLPERINTPWASYELSPDLPKVALP